MKRVLVPILVLIVLIAVYLNQTSVRDRKVAPERTENFLNLKNKEINSFKVNSTKGVYDFDLINGKWYLMLDSIPRPADPLAVQLILDSASNLSVGALESDNPDNRLRYGVDDYSGTELSFYYKDSLLASIIVGKYAQGSGYCYVRKPDENEVYPGSGLMPYLLDKPESSWRDRTLIEIDTAMLHSIEFRYPDDVFTLYKLDNLWYASGNNLSGTKNVWPDSIEIFRRSLVKLNVNDFYQPTDSEFVDLDSPDLIMTIKLTDGNQEKLIFCGKSEGDNRFYVVKEGDDQVYVLYSSTQPRLVKPKEYFIGSEKNS